MDGLFFYTLLPHSKPLITWMLQISICMTSCGLGIQRVMSKKKEKQQSVGTVIIPIYMQQMASLHRLESVLDTLPSIASSVIVVAQAKSDILALFRSFAESRGITVREFSKRIGKWPAFAAGLKLLSGEEDWIVVFDGDGAFPGTVLPSLVAPIVEGIADHVIGQRDLVRLSARDQVTSDSRLYIEAFFNTVVLVLLGIADAPAFRCFDIQSGLHAFSAARCKNISLGQLPFYGGELFLFMETMYSGGRIIPVPVTTQENPPSGYLLAEVITNLLALDWLAATPDHVFIEALNVAPDLYKPWIRDATSFRREIRITVLERRWRHSR
jgi:glycosyltransferase involved in cell wall biosynthesis